MTDLENDFVGGAVCGAACNTGGLFACGACR